MAPAHLQWGMKMRLSVDNATGDVIVTYNVASSDTDSGEETRQVIIADTDRMRPLDENSRVVAIALVSINTQLERIADALEAMAQAPSPTAKTAGRGKADG